MRKLVVLAFLAAVVAAIAAGSAAAKPPGTNGLISFTRFDPALHQDVVYTINPDGSGERPLLVGAESGHWSPDGSRILVGPDCCAERILNPDDGSYTELPTFYPDLGLFLGCNVWSPDGARLACEGFGDQPSADGVYTIRSSDGGDVRRVTSGADDDYPGDYSPNGKRIVFLRSSFDSGSIAIYTVKPDGSDLRQLTPPGMNLDFTGGSWSPQGNEILLSGKLSAGQRSSTSEVVDTLSAWRLDRLVTNGALPEIVIKSWSLGKRCRQVGRRFFRLPRLIGCTQGICDTAFLGGDRPPAFKASRRSEIRWRLPRGDEPRFGRSPLAQRNDRGTQCAPGTRSRPLTTLRISRSLPGNGTLSMASLSVFCPRRALSG